MGEFDRLLRELPSGVRQSHVDSILAIYESARFEDQVCVQFKRDHIERYIADDNLRYNVVDKIYGKSRDRLADFWDLSNLAPRLQTLVGTCTTQPSPDTKDVDILELTERLRNRTEPELPYSPLLACCARKNPKNNDTKAKQAAVANPPGSLRLGRWRSKR